MATKTLRLTDDEQVVLFMALEFYIRMGLGQFSEIAQRLDLLHGTRVTPEQLHNIRHLCEELEGVMWDDQAPWSIYDEDTGLHTLIAFGLEARLAGNAHGQRWARQRIKERAVVEKIDYRET